MGRVVEGEMEEKGEEGEEMVMDIEAERSVSNRNIC